MLIINCIYSSFYCNFSSRPKYIHIVRELNAALNNNKKNIKIKNIKKKLLKKLRVSRYTRKTRGERENLRYIHAQILDLNRN